MPTFSPRVLLTPSRLCQVAVAALRDHPKDESVQDNGLSVLWNVSVSQAHKDAVVAAGGVELAAAALRTFARHVGVQESGLGLLRNLMDSSIHKDSVAEAGGVLGAVRALRTHPNSERVLHQARGHALDGLLHAVDDEAFPQPLPV